MEELYIAETYLSRKPEKLSVEVGIAFTLVLLIASMLYWQNFAGIGEKLPGNPEAVFQKHEYWRAITAILVHADLEHLLSNAPGFAFLTGLVFGYYGMRTCLLLVLGAGAAVTLASLWTYPPNAVLTGASGVVYLLAAFWLTMYVFLERRYGIAGRLMRGIGFSLVMLFPTALVPEVSYRTHAIGFGLGVAVAIAFFLWKKEYYRRFEIYEYAS